MFAHIRQVVSVGSLSHSGWNAPYVRVDALHETRRCPICINQSITWRSTNLMISSACFSYSIAKLCEFSCVRNIWYTDWVVLRLNVSWISSQRNKLGRYTWFSVACYNIDPKWISNTKGLCAICKGYWTSDIYLNCSSVVVISCRNNNLRI
jgi:hypothetical protein